MRAALLACSLPWLVAGCSPQTIGEGRQAIIGGVRDTGDPAVVLLVSYPPDKSTFVTCTASLIAPTVLLTAAHCVDATNHPGHTYGMFAGDDASAYATATQIATVLTPVSSVHPHPAYDPAPPFVADIAVAILEQATTIASLPIARAPLAPTLPGEPARLVGYGQTTYQTYNAKKYAATTTVASLPDDDTVVVGDSLRHSCLGDSGGPALVALNGAETIIGVDSFTDTSGCTQPAHYRRVDQYLPFIDGYAPPAVPADLGAVDLALPIADAAIATDAAVDEGPPSLDGGCAFPVDGRNVTAKANGPVLLLLLALLLLAERRR